MIELEAKLRDRPGELLRFLKPISENAGNIHGIIHSHKNKKGGLVPVLVRFEIIAENKINYLENIKKSLLKMNIKITRITSIPAVHQMACILSGHVFRSNIEDIMRRLKKIKVRIQELEAKLNDPDDISNVKLTLEIPDEVEDRVVVNKLEKICNEKNLFLLVEERL
ncbi:MAG: hypothetical protein ACTSRZ_13085 [Promethearchaeota archaeon]